MDQANYQFLILNPINIQFYVFSDGIKDFNQLSSKIVAEALMLEMKMSPAAKTVLISGYPRNMRDVVEYTNKVTR